MARLDTKGPIPGISSVGDLRFDVCIWLVVEPPLWKICQLGWLFPIYGKINNVPNHQPGCVYTIVYLSIFSVRWPIPDLEFHHAVGSTLKQMGQMGTCGMGHFERLWALPVLDHKDILENITQMTMVFPLFSYETVIYFVRPRTIIMNMICQSMDETEKKCTPKIYWLILILRIGD